MKSLIVMCALMAVGCAIPIDSDAVVAEIQPVQTTQLRRVDSPLSAYEPEGPVTVYDGSSAVPADSQTELVRPKRFLLLKKIALAKAAALGIGALGVGAIALKAGGGLGGGLGGSGGYGNSYGSGYNNGWSNSGYGGGLGGYGNSHGSGSNNGWSSGGYSGNYNGWNGSGNGIHKTLVVWD